MALTNIRTVTVPSIGKLPLADNPGTFTPSGVTRKHKPGRLAEDGGATESATPAKLELSLNATEGLDIVALNAVAREDVTVRLSDGQVHMMSLAFVTDPAPLDGEGSVKITIMSNTSERIS